MINFLKQLVGIHVHVWGPWSIQSNTQVRNCIDTNCNFLQRKELEHIHRWSKYVFSPFTSVQHRYYDTRNVFSTGMQTRRCLDCDYSETEEVKSISNY